MFYTLFLDIQKRDATGQPVVQLKVLWTGADPVTASMGLPPVVTKRYTPIPKKVGEVGLFQTVFDVSLWDGPRRRPIVGDLQFTNYRLIFSSFLDDEGTDYHVGAHPNSNYFPIHTPTCFLFSYTRMFCSNLLSFYSVQTSL